MSQAFAADEVRAVYRAIHERRDMRHFAGGRWRPSCCAGCSKGRTTRPVSDSCSLGGSFAFATVPCVSVCTM